MSNYLFSLCDPKKSISSFTTPPVRVELQDSPYSIQIHDKLNGNNMRLITQDDLNMRRKVEILKYNSNNVSTQTNSLTKSQKWSNIVSRRSNYVVNSSSSKLIHRAISDCPEKPSPSNNADVPGQTILLYQNDDVPLYNYNNNLFSHSVLPPSTLQDWLNKADSNVSVYDAVALTKLKLKYQIYSTISNIYIQNTGTGYYNYSLSSPIAFTFFGFYTPPNTATVTLTIKELYLTVFYNGNIVGNKIYPDYPVSLQKYTFTISNGSSTSNSSIGFKATVFLTNLKWNSINLPNKSNFTYSLNLNTSYNLGFDTNVKLKTVEDDIKNNVSPLPPYDYFLANFITTGAPNDITNNLSIVSNVIEESSIYSLKYNP